ncbi:MAG: baseplate J/gp47 family protein, partial [Nitrospirota bacterium]
EQLALATPGVPIGRAKALADYDPRLSCVSAPGAVTVIVLSQCPQTHPAPSPDLLRAVAHYLERRRLLTTEVHVIGPEYTKVAVRATLHATPETSSRELIAQATASLNQFFDPISGGPDGSGWPMGRAVYRAEILALLNALPGVVYVDEVILETVVKSPTAACDCCQEQERAIPARCGNIDICPHGLVVPGQHHITVSIERAVP